jgi:hypothetical protein
MFPRIRFPDLAGGRLLRYQPYQPPKAEKRLRPLGAAGLFESVRQLQHPSLAKRRTEDL